MTITLTNQITRLKEKGFKISVNHARFTQANFKFLDKFSERLQAQNHKPLDILNEAIGFMPIPTTELRKNKIEMAPRGGKMPNAVRVLPIAIGADNVTSAVRIIGWSMTVGDDPANRLWIPLMLAELACTASTAVGIGTTADVLATERFADTLSLTHGNANVSVEFLSNAANVIAHAVCDLKGAMKLEFSFHTNSSATSVNALYAIMY